ncbi:MAG: M28 family peptidase, partial [Acidimicrobiales bacterium]|nr:M28 family peptidase [Acidimicrobiales bacterium]
TGAAIFGWIETVVAEGIRRPGYPADRWAEEWCADRFREIGLSDVALEPVQVLRWEPTEWSLEVTAGDGTTTTLDCFPVPYAAPVDGLDVELAAFDRGAPATVAGKAALYDVTLLRLPGDFMAGQGSIPEKAAPASRAVDPDGTLRGEHVIPFGADFQGVLEPSMDAGASAFIGVLSGYPGDSYEYFVPYDGVERPLPGVWIRGSDGARLHDMLAAGPVRVRLSVATDVRTVESYNVVGELPGADDDVVMIASHHDGPWASAVEDGSGIALVLAQATYWAARPADERPHRLRFLLQGGHMSGGAGLHRYIEDHRAELASVVLEVHLEHAALEVADPPSGPAATPDDLVPAGLATPRWWFTSRNPDLEAAVLDALTTEQLGRSMLAAPDAFGEQPPTDGAFYHAEGVPIVNLLAAPFYLFDAMDTLDKVDRDNLVPLTRATIRIVDSTRGVSASAMRAGVES